MKKITVFLRTALMHPASQKVTEYCVHFVDNTDKDTRIYNNVCVIMSEDGNSFTYPLDSIYYIKEESVND